MEAPGNFTTTALMLSLEPEHGEARKLTTATKRKTRRRRPITTTASGSKAHVHHTITAIVEV
jgi:hypothetical protein